MLSLADFGKNAGLSAGTLEPAKRTVKGLILLNSNLRHLYPPSRAWNSN